METTVTNGVDFDRALGSTCIIYFSNQIRTSSYASSWTININSTGATPWKVYNARGTATYTDTFGGITYYTSDGAGGSASSRVYTANSNPMLVFYDGSHYAQIVTMEGGYGRSVSYSDS